MDHGKLPDEIQGNWVWEKSLINEPQSSLLVRKEFILNRSQSVADFWISANCSYQLFINERLVGFGPRANHSASSTYVDQYDFSYYLQQGANVIAIIVSHTQTKSHYNKLKVPGVWCQLDLEHKPYLWMDEEWDVFPKNNFTRPCSRMNDKRGMTEAIDYGSYPVGWMKSPATLDFRWHKPDYVISMTKIKDNLEICPLTPNSVDDIYFFENVGKGAYKPDCGMTHLDFNEIFTDPGIYAAVTFLFMDVEQQLEVEVSGDEPYKLFCNKALVKVKRKQQGGLFRDENNKIDLKLKAGWNRLLVLQDIETPGSGINFIFPSITVDGLKIFQDTLEDADESWNIAGPLRMPLSEATPSISFERLNSQSYKASFENAVDIANCLKVCDFKRDDVESSNILKEGEYLLLKLQELKYGFLSLDIKASDGDIIDISIGQFLRENDFPFNTDRIRNTHTLFCIAGENKFNKFKPEEICYVMISARKAAGEVEILDTVLSEFSRHHNNHTAFECSDPELNEIWRVGSNATQRASSFVCQNEPSVLNTCCLGDFYFQSCNLISVFGDYHLSEVWLRNFGEAQFENGNIPAISFGEKVYSQLSHLFLFPTWLLYHYRTSADDNLLRKMVQHLDLIFELFKSIIDEETGLFKDIDKHFKATCRLDPYSDPESGISTTINSLYCRFLLSSGEIYRVLERPKELFKCFKQAAVINKKINEHNWNSDKHLFAINDIDPEDCSSLFANFIAVYSGVSEHTEFENIFNEFFNLDTPFSKLPEQSEIPYFNFLFMETMFALGQTQWTLEYMKDYWMRRIDKDCSAWRIRPDAKEIATTDFYRGNTVSPNMFLISEVAGIRVAEPGYTTVYFNPAIEFVSYAKLLLPTVYGSIRVEWERLEDGSLEVTIDAKFPIKVLPELSPESLKQTTFTLGESVTLLDAESMLEEL